MKRFLSAFLIGASLVMATTFAGMAILGMESGMPMSGMACVDHCLSSLPISAPTSFNVFALTVILLVTALVFSGRSSGVDRFDRRTRRWHRDVGKFLLHQELSTIVLRN